jgi:hypothetical protein
LLSFLSLLIISSLTHAQQQTLYKLTQIANLKHENITDTNWVNLLESPRSNALYYIANKKGQLYIVDEGKIKTPAIVDFSQLKKNKNNQYKQLNTIVLHPNFAFRDQPGFATFYTAHVESAQQDPQTKRLSVQQSTVDYLFDTVVTEWQFNLANLQKVNLNSQREIIRIALPEGNEGINQLAFNPYKKSWDDNFGFLYLSLTQSKTLKNHPLYSGAILRIKPNKFGQKAYTFPADNPFVSDTTIANELFIIGIGKIEQFIWPQKNNNNLLISHKKNNQSMLSFSDRSHDWQQDEYKTAIINNEHLPSLMVYRGRALTALRKKIILIHKNVGADNKNWQISTTDFMETDYLKNNKKGPNITAVWQLSSDIIASKNTIKVQAGNKNELLLIDKTSQFIYGIDQKPEIISTKKEAPQTLAAPTSSNTLLFIFLSLFLLVGATYLVRYYQKKKKSSSRLIKNSYSRVEISTSNASLSLFKHRQKTADITFKITDITSIEIKLNNIAIHTMKAKTNSVPNHASFQASNAVMSNEIETQIRTCFSGTHQEKMVTDKVRNISLLITSNQKKAYLVTLYLRKGNHRFTKSTWSKIIEDLLNLVWVFAEIVAVDKIEKRTFIPKVDPQCLPLPFAQQTNAPASETKAPNVQALIPKNISPKNISAKVLAQKTFGTNKKTEEQAVQQNDTKNSTLPHLIDTELINALEKLVNLKKQGFLTDSEFDLAKKKVLKDLIDENK